MNRFAALALAASLFTPIAAHADDGHWIDTKHRMSLEGMPDGTEAAGRLLYAKDICRSKTGQVQGAPAAPGWDACMKAQGYVWLWDSATQVAANRKAEQDARNRAMLHELGNALIGTAQAINESQVRHNCSGSINRGNIDMTCN